jgi:hypothetical protein
VFVNGEVGVVIFASGRPAAVMGFTIQGHRITAIEAINDRARVRSFVLPLAERPS